MDLSGIIADETLREVIALLLKTMAVGPSFEISYDEVFGDDVTLKTKFGEVRRTSMCKNMLLRLGIEICGSKTDPQLTVPRDIYERLTSTKVHLKRLSI